MPLNKEIIKLKIHPKCKIGSCGRYLKKYVGTALQNIKGGVLEMLWSIENSLKYVYSIPRGIF